MRSAQISLHGKQAGILREISPQKEYRFDYLDDYLGPPISLAMPVKEKTFGYGAFPPFFDGLLPEGNQLEGLLKIQKIDRYDYFSQLIAVGNDLIGAVTVEDFQG